jgi:coenzyme F420-reducing hydrogenase gamma subunit
VSHDGQSQALGVWKLTSCDGCQMQAILAWERLAELPGLRVAHFPEAGAVEREGGLAVSLVEGSVSQARQVDKLRAIRERSRFLVAMGACAVHGGVQALVNFSSPAEMAGRAYPHPEYLEPQLGSRPLADYVEVDLELRGCPVSRERLFESVQGLLAGRIPRPDRGSVCRQCKRAGLPCLLVSRGEPCLGPVTQAGCGALCPAAGRGCYGCYGPQESANPRLLAGLLERHCGLDREAVGRALRHVACWAPEFRQESQSHD